MKLALAFLVVAGSLSSPSAAQTTIVVEPGESIQTAIDEAIDGDTILVNGGTYAPIDFMGKAINVVGVDEPVIDAAGTVAHAVTFARGEGPASVLEGFEIVNGAATGYDDDGKGGGVFALGATPTLRDCLIRGNSAENGGAGVAGDCTLEHCVIAANTSGTANGAVVLGTPRLTSGPGDGGAVWGAPRLVRCVVESNVAHGGVLGGGLSLQGGAHVEHCIIRRNSVDGDASGVFVAGPNVVLLRCFVVENLASAGSTARGAIVASVSVLIENCTVYGNQGNGDAGLWGPCKILNTIVGKNSGKQIVSAPYPGSAAVRYSDVELGYPGIGNLSLAPLFTATGTFHLSAHSPCIDAGDPTILDPDGSRSDIGAYPFRTRWVGVGEAPVPAGRTGLGPGRTLPPLSW